MYIVADGCCILAINLYESIEISAQLVMLLAIVSCIVDSHDLQLSMPTNLV